MDGDHDFGAGEQVHLFCNRHGFQGHRFETLLCQKGFQKFGFGDAAVLCALDIDASFGPARRRAHGGGPGAERLQLGRWQGQYRVIFQPDGIGQPDSLGIHFQGSEFGEAQGR